jgi:hypothetical protein
LVYHSAPEMKNLSVVGALLIILRTASAFVHPIGIHGRYFVDTVTREPFFVKGVDYQPGGSSFVTEEFDPLSDSNSCARDIILFQELNINVRIYPSSILSMPRHLS